MRGDIRRRSLRIDHDRGQPLNAGKPRMPPLPGLTDFLSYSHPTTGAVGYGMPPGTRALGCLPSFG